MNVLRSTLLVAGLLLVQGCGDQAQEAQVAPPEAQVEAPAEAPGVEGAPQAAADAVTAEVAGEGADALYARSCASCHGETAQGVGDNPSLIGLSRADIESRLTAYRNGETLGPKSAIMASMAKPLSDAQIADLAAYLGH